MQTIKTITVEYILALENEQPREFQQFQQGITLREAIPFFTLDKKAKTLIKEPVYGVFNQVVKEDYCLQDGDRIEVYRPLEIDPKQARRIRAERDRAKLKDT